MSAHDDEHEPIPGLPRALPPGESIVWQGSPAWRPLARQVFKIRWVAGYLAVMLLARGVVAYSSQEDPGAALAALATMAVLFGAALAILALMAWLHARSAIYTITTHRIVMRIGPALSMTWNVPFRRITSADLVLAEDGIGDVVMRVDERGGARSWLLWPHVCSGPRFEVRPALRCLPDSERVAERLRAAVVAWSSRHAQDVRLGRVQAAHAETAVGPGMALETH